MKNKVKAEIMILYKARMFKWILGLFLIFIVYSFYSVAFLLQVPEEGGYYTYTLLSLAFLIGVIVPIGTGALLGGYDWRSRIIEYKLTNQSKSDWLISKVLALTCLTSATLLCLNTIGLVMDVTCHSIYGSPVIILERFCVVFFVWMLWGGISFTLSLLMESSGISFLISMLIFYGEQYIGRYVSIPFGIVWNQKSLEHVFFHSEEIPYGVVQDYYETPEKSLLILIVCFLLCCVISCVYMNRKYPEIM